MKVLFHIDEQEKWQLVIDNVRNMLTYAKEQGTFFEIEIVANAAAVTGLIDLKNGDTVREAAMRELAAKKVRFAACQNALRKFNAEQKPLYDFADTVPAGVVEIAMRQQEGYSYIKP